MKRVLGAFLTYVSGCDWWATGLQRRLSPIWGGDAKVVFGRFESDVCRRVVTAHGKRLGIFNHEEHEGNKVQEVGCVVVA